MSKSIIPPGDEIADFCRRHRIRKLSVFGSALGEDFRPDSDVDLLVEFEPGAVKGFAIIDLEEELARRLKTQKTAISRIENHSEDIHDK